MIGLYFMMFLIVYGGCEFGFIKSLFYFLIFIFCMENYLFFGKDC